MTAAERQRRDRKKLRREKKAAELVLKRELNQRRWRERMQKWEREGPPPPSAKQLERQAEQREVEAKAQELAQQNPPLANATPTDELARQIGEFLTECPEITIEDVHAAIDRRFGPP